MRIGSGKWRIEHWPIPRDFIEGLSGLAFGGRGGVVMLAIALTFAAPRFGIAAGDGGDARAIVQFRCLGSP